MTATARPGRCINIHSEAAEEATPLVITCASEEEDDAVHTGTASCGMPAPRTRLSTGAKDAPRTRLSSECFEGGEPEEDGLLQRK